MLADKEHVLLGFDGVICTVFDRRAAHEVADRLRLMTGPRLPGDVAVSGDPFDVLRFALTHGPTMAQTVELELRRWELAAVRRSEPRSGVAAALRGLRLAGHTVTIVSNTSGDAVGAHLVRNSLTRYVDEVIGRNSAELTPLKPDPFLVRQAIMSLSARADTCVMAVAKATDAQAARAAGVDVVDVSAVSLKRVFQ
ncbi:MAG TPA: HAD hydrolase-like protein [Pseudonocardiaceae bacterium]|jgi:beta-phosphoglucomutase-like phosphatase (HAD superfamily)|nr:HAD hydrolase-like protein [Pseudonocardiaceae bacterium]